MSLFDSASIVVTPNAYKASKLYAIKPIDGSGDLTVVRATSATRVDANGFVEIPRTNLLLRSEQFDNASWIGVNGGLGSLPTRTPNVAIAPDGNLTADLVVFNINNGTSSADISQIQQNLSLTSSIHTFSIYAKSSDNITRIVKVVMPSGNVFKITITANWQRFTITDTAVGTGAIRLRLRGNESTAKIANLHLWGAQLEEGVSATEYIPTVASIRTKFAGITQDGSSASNIPRLDYTNSTCPSILVEPQRTNLVAYSEEFDNAYWVKQNITVTANSTTSPDGTNSADTFIANNVSTQHRFDRAISGTGGTTYTFSAFFKAKEYDKIALRTGNGGIGYFNLTLGTVISADSGVTANIVNFGNGWYRCSVSQILTTTSTMTSRINILDENGLLTFAGNNTKGLYLWGAQLEAGSNATSYIKTEATTVTRNADVISKTGISSLIGQTEGTIYADVNINNLSIPNRQIFNITSGTPNFVSLSFLNTNVLRAVIRANGGTQYNVSTTAKPIGRYKLAATYKAGELKLYVNGVLIGTNTSASVSFSTALERLNLDNSVIGSDNFSDKINLVANWKTALTDQECINLTTI